MRFTLVTTGSWGHNPVSKPGSWGYKRAGTLSWWPGGSFMDGALLVRAFDGTDYSDEANIAFTVSNPSTAGPPAKSVIPGFADQLVGAKSGERRTVNVDFPADFVTPQLAGKKGVYEVEVVEVKEKHLPALDEAFAKAYGAESLEKLRVGVRKDLENELKFKRDKTIRAQLLQELLARVQFELPESSAAQETRNVVYDIVQENAKRGVSREVIEKQKEQIFSAATKGARERVKLDFVLQKIAEKEDIKVSQQEIAQRIAYLAALYQMPCQV